MNKEIVSMEQKLCPICNITFNSDVILIKRNLRPTLNRSTLTGYQYCKQCQSKIDDGYIGLIGVKNDTEENTRLKIEDANRTGDLIFIKKEAAEQLFNVEEKLSDMMFIDEDVVTMLKEEVAKHAEKPD